MRIRLLLILFALLAAAVSAERVQAQSCAAETEPNGDPLQAQRISGCAGGTLGEADTDLYRFTVPPEQGGWGFSLVLDGIPNSLSRAELLEVRGNDRPRSLSLLTSPSGDEVRSETLLLESGDYLVGVYSGGGTGPYEVRIETGQAPPASGDKEPNDRQDQAAKVSGAFALSGSLAYDADTYAWEVRPAEARQAWTVTAQAALSRNVILSLYDASGVLLARRGRDAAGRAALADLKLAAGTYSLRLEGDGRESNAYRLTATSLGVPAPGAEVEPNDYREQAQPWTTDESVIGRLSGGDDLDSYWLAVGPASAAERFELRLRSDSRERRTLCLRLADNSSLQCREALGEVALSDLTPAPGEYLVVITGNADPAEQYNLSKVVTGERQAGREDEPNDLYTVASPLDEQNRAVGRFSGADADYYRLAVTGKPQLWRIQAIGDGIGSVSVVNAVGSSVQYVGAAGQRRVRLNGVYLLPGTHYIAVRGEGGEYRLVAIPLGPPPEGVEREPNDSLGQADPLPFGAERTGLLNESGDADWYRFTLAAEEHVRLSVAPPDDVRLQVRLWWDDGFEIARQDDMAAGSTAYVLDTVLEPGDYGLRLTPAQPGDSPYTLKLERRDPFEPLYDREPNGAADLAGPLPATLEVSGRVTQWSDEDWYRLPALAANTGVTMSAPPAVSLAVYDAKGQPLSSGWARDGSGTYTGSLSASAPQPLALKVTGDGPYTVRLAFAQGPATAPEPTPLPLKLALAFEPARVAAFWPTGQAVSGTLSLENSGAQPLIVALDAHTSHIRIEARAGPGQVTVPARGRSTVPVTLVVAADLPDGTFPVTWRARAAGGGQATARAEIIADVDAPPQSPRQVWPIPDSMLGGLNAAALSLGAQVVTPDSDLAQRQAVLHDGYTALQDAFRVGADRLPAALTVKLAGEAALPVAGLLLNPQSAGPAYEKLSDFELWLSADGQSYSRALSGRLSTLLAEQAFPLPQPVPARYARLVLLGNHQGNRGNVALGEWKVVAAPGTAVGAPFNLAAPANGGQVVYVKPQPGAADQALSTLIPDGREDRLPLAAGQAAEWVIGFEHGRAAQVASLQWVDPPGLDPAQRFAVVEVSASLDGPAGPWTPLGQWKLTAGPSTLTLPSPVWARYLRFRSAASAKEARPALPDVLRVLERPTGPEYRSVLGEWGHYSREGAYEWVTPLPSSGADPAAAGNDTQATARRVTAGSEERGTVQIGGNEAWYRIDVPAGQNAVVLRLTGRPTVGVTTAFQDGDGRKLPVSTQSLSPAAEIITATVTGGSTVFLRIEEPPRSVVFGWDNSSSLGAYQDQIYSALTSYIEGVTPGREVANLLPFGGAMLLDTWGEEPAALQQALNDYDRADGSSNAEEALLVAAGELAYRQGTKAVVLITDAESNGYDLTARLWDALAEVRPRLFTLAVSSHISVGEAPANPQDLMQNWAAVNGGHYDFLRTIGELDVAFSRAAAWLRRPAAYSFTAQTASLPPPKPGRLSVKSSLTGDDAAARAALLGDTAVEIILDASGSMLEKLGGSTRIAVARQTMTALVDTILPPGIPLALRAFGNREGGGSCRTDLELPLAPLDPAAVKAKVATITPQKQGGTPIAASLLKVGDDLKGAGAGPKLVILLTDGEESCKGDPAASITALQKQGIDVRLNIVGFTVTDKGLKAKMARWAAAGGGQFLPAADQKALEGALVQALRVPYRVLNEEGQVAAQGLVDGDPVELPVGVYRVEILTNPTQVLEGVTVGSGRDTVERVSGR